MKRKTIIKCYNCDHVWMHGGKYRKKLSVSSKNGPPKEKKIKTL